ncbi:MAG: DNA internalization-related competence protein ComEC/Rec2 [Marinospirillum sp.]|uniref:DNA internalization-related competence protein ComEC/Rec2 n=1 Tax=Marinospirillum sp. TaxID=2183934 RepID=UPI0019FE5DEA|nr:DNA internalization-related competence protein ComEC/Rec2 [Marinospirillum sp.]MBE0506127.1 DNA internalization-related competence protein ComEC/Rec2 [Marinospirillum sp.]
MFHHPVKLLPQLATGLLCGILAALDLSIQLPPEILICLLLFTLHQLRRHRYFIAALVFGYVWLLIFLAWRMELAPSQQDISHPVQLVGQILESSHSPGGLSSITLRVQECQRTSGEACQLQAPGHIRLNWYPQQTPPAVGEIWQLQAHVRPLRSLKNFGQTPSTGRHLAAGLVARGYVHRQAEVQRLESAQGLSAISNRLSHSLQQYPMNEQGRRMLMALGLGEKQALTAADWRMLERTGTVHLWVISGLHLGLLAGLMLWLAKRLHWPIGLALPLAAAVALVYAQLAGWGMPAQRASIMLIMGLLLISGWRQLSPWTAYCLALILLLIFNPLLPLTRGFWLSFGAVGILITTLRGLPAAPGWLNLIRVQWVLTLGLTPLLIWQGAWFSLLAPLVNLLAVPLLGLLLLPLTLIGLLVLWLTGQALPLAWLAEGFAGLAVALQWSADLPMPNIQHPHFLWMGLLVLLPPGFPARSLAWLGLLLAFIPAAPDQTQLQQQDHWKVHVLDVGQGTAILVQSQGQNLLYDTGRGFDTGWAPVVPALEPLIGQQVIHQLVISHDDSDHSGGLEAVSKRWSIKNLWAAGAKTCQAGDQWTLGQLDVLALWPPQPITTRRNNADSCVLLIRGKNHSLLLTGDAGVGEEAFFSQALPELLQQQPLTLLISGHHGSQTSTSATLLQASRPHWAIHTTSWRNSYGHPHALVVQRLRQNKVDQLDTGEQGAIQFVLGDHQPMMSYWRQQYQPLWQGISRQP